MTRLYLYAALAMAVALGGTYFIYGQREAGRAAERQKQEKANAEFRVRAAQGAVDYDVCDRAGGLYDFRKSACQLP